MKKLLLLIIIFLAITAHVLAQFGSQQVIITSADGACSVYANDLDGDGDTDLVTTNWMSEDLSVLHNNGDGEFAADIRVALEERARRAFVADFNDDGLADLAIPSREGTAILLNQGDDTFVVADVFRVSSLASLIR